MILQQSARGVKLFSFAPIYIAQAFYEQEEKFLLTSNNFKDSKEYKIEGFQTRNKLLDTFEATERQ